MLNAASSGYVGRKQHGVPWTVACTPEPASRAVVNVTKLRSANYYVFALLPARNCLSILFDEVV